MRFWERMTIFLGYSRGTSGTAVPLLGRYELTVEAAINPQQELKFEQTSAVTRQERAPGSGRIEVHDRGSCFICVNRRRSRFHPESGDYVFAGETHQRFPGLSRGS